MRDGFAGTPRAAGGLKNVASAADYNICNLTLFDRPTAAFTPRTTILFFRLIPRS
jgi:hypothetical protein